MNKIPEVKLEPCVKRKKINEGLFWSTDREGRYMMVYQ
jgi:hypothetical protein